MPCVKITIKSQVGDESLHTCLHCSFIPFLLQSAFCEGGERLVSFLTLVWISEQWPMLGVCWIFGPPLAVVSCLVPSLFSLFWPPGYAHAQLRSVTLLILPTLPLTRLVPRCHPKNQERGVVTLANFLVCAESAYDKIRNTCWSCAYQ